MAARTNVPKSVLVANGSIAAPTGTAIDQTNGMNVVIGTTAIPSAANLESLFLVVGNSAAGTKNAIVRAGSPPPAFRSGIGDLTVAVGAGATVWVGPLETARFAQADGSLNLDFEAGMTGTVIAALLPKRV